MSVVFVSGMILFAAMTTSAFGPPCYTGEVTPTPQEAAYHDEVVVLVDEVDHVDLRIEDARASVPASRLGGVGRASVPASRLGDNSEDATLTQPSPHAERGGRGLRSPFEGGGAEGAGGCSSAPLVRRLWDERMDAYLAFAQKSDLPRDNSLPVIFATAASDEGVSLLEGLGLSARLDPLPPEAYILRISRDGIFAVGKTGAGMVNAAASLLRLLHVIDGKLVARCADIVDWPVFTTRYTAEYGIADTAFFDWMTLNKINGFAVCYPATKWQGWTDTQRAQLATVNDYKQYGTLSFMAQFHVGGRRNEPLDCANDEQVARLLDTIRETIALADADHIMICYDDVTPALQPEEAKQFDHPADAHGALMERVYAAVKDAKPACIVSFCTPYYQGRGHRRWRDDARREEGLAYLTRVKDWPNKDIRIVWTGPVTESRSITAEDIAAYREWVGDSTKLFYWDNTWHYHQPLRNFHAAYKDGFVDDCADRTSYINVNGTSVIGRFFAITANDYYWNPDAFDAGRARRAAVAMTMGEAAVSVAERFYELRGDAYNVYFIRDVDLDALAEVFRALEAASLTPELPAYCWSYYEGIVKDRAEKDAKE